MSSVERDRLAELRDAFERRSSRRGLGAARQLVQVYDGGAIPTTVPKMFLARPTGNGTAEAEGASMSITPDSSQSVPVLVLGPEVPSAGDFLVATVISGRWVSEKRGSTPVLTCSPCGIPLADLTLSWSGGSFGTGSITLAHIVTVDGFGDPLDLWEGSQAFTFGDLGDDTIQFVLSCSSGLIKLHIATNAGIVSGSCATDFPPTTELLEITADRDCTPFHLHYTTTSPPANTAPICQFLWCPGCGTPRSYIRDFFIDF